MLGDDRILLKNVPSFPRDIAIPVAWTWVEDYANHSRQKMLLQVLEPTDPRKIYELALYVTHLSLLQSEDIRGMLHIMADEMAKRWENRHKKNE